MTSLQLRSLPLKLPPTGEDSTLICICGHWINYHQDGLSNYSPCEEDDGFCGCVHPEVDYEVTYIEEHLVKTNERWYIVQLTSDGKKQWTLSGSDGFPRLKEKEPLIVK